MKLWNLNKKLHSKQNNLSKRVVKLLANILEGWHSGYCGGLENRWFRKGLASSSLAPSAILKQKLFLCREALTF